MPPATSQDPPLPQMRYCAIARHRLKQPSRKINDPNVHRFAKRINSEIRLGSSMCLICYEKLIQIYRMKMANAQKHIVDKRKNSGNSVSDLSSSQQMDSSSDPSIVNPPQRGWVTMRKKVPILTPVSSRSSSTSNDDRPSTSISSAAKKSGDAPPPASESASETLPPPSTPSAPPPPSPLAVVSRTSYVSDDDDPNSNLSLNAVNGTRLPHIQPIPKRRQFVHLNKVAMDIYLAGTTGG